MKVITVNFLTCAVKACRNSPAATPLHFKDAELEQQELDFNPELIRNILPRIDWDSLKVTAQEVSASPLASFSYIMTHAPLHEKLTSYVKLGFPNMLNIKPDDNQIDEAILKDLHKLLMETHVMEGKLCCANCGHEYQIKEGIANFLLPSHLGRSLLRKFFSKVKIYLIFHCSLSFPGFSMPNFTESRDVRLFSNSHL